MLCILKEPLFDIQDVFSLSSSQVARANFNEDPYVRDFGLSIDPNMVTVTGRILPPPLLQYGGKIHVSVCTVIYMSDSVYTEMMLAVYCLRVHICICVCLSVFVSQYFWCLGPSVSVAIAHT